MGWTILPLATPRTEQNRTRMEQLEKKKQEQNDWKKRNKKRMIGKKEQEQNDLKKRNKNRTI